MAHLLRRAVVCGAVLVLLAAVTRALTRRRVATWGSSDDEVAEHLPGDELIGDPATSTTRAVTIEAPADVVWSWLVQIGTDRGGWYTYDRLERLAGVDVHNADERRDEWQHLEVGDRVCLAPAGWMGIDRGMLLPVANLIEGRSIVLRQQPPDSPWDGVWSFHVRPIDPDRCRLLIRSRTLTPPGASRLSMALMGVVMDPVAFVMERGMLLGIKRRAERSGRAQADHQADHQAVPATG
jgi:hypothetical protein